MKVDGSSKQCVVAVYPERLRAEAAFRELEAAAIPTIEKRFIAEAVEVRRALSGYLPRQDRSMPDAVIGGIVGAVAGAVLGVLIVITIRTAMGATSQALLAVPAGLAAAGFVAGSLIGAMRGWELPQDQAGDYENDVRRGHPLVVAVGQPEELLVATHLLEDTQPEKIHVHATTADDHVERSTFYAKGVSNAP